MIGLLDFLVVVRGKLNENSLVLVTRDFKWTWNDIICVVKGFLRVSRPLHTILHEDNDDRAAAVLRIVIES